MKFYKNFNPKINKQRKPRFVLLFFSVFIALLTSFIVYRMLTAEDASTWFNSSWQYRKEITIDYNQVAGSANHSNFPVLIKTTDTDLRDNALSNGHDILFTDDSDVKLSHEIESYNSSTGELVAWVNIPSLSYNTNTTLYMYYGNSGASDQQDVANVWDSSDYKAVFHLSEDTNGSAPQLNDSSGNDNHMTTSGSMSSSNSQTPGQIDGSVEFNGSSDYSSASHDASLNVTNNFSISAWIYRTGSGQSATSVIIGKKNGTGGDNVYALGLQSSNRIRFRTNPVTQILSTDDSAGIIPLETWTHVVGTYDGSTRRIFINGQENNSESHSQTNTDSSDSLDLGSNSSSPTNRYFPGQIDEARVMGDTLSAAWIETEYNNQSDPASFMSFGSQQMNAAEFDNLHFGFNEGEGTSVNSSLDTATGTISGATWQTEDLCVFGKCLFFDGSNDLVSTNFSNDATRSVSFWFRPMLGSDPLIQLSATANIEFSAGAITTSGITSPTIYVNGSTNNSITSNRWHHVVVTTNTNIDADDIKIGQVSTNYFQGFIDEFKILDSTLSSDQVKAEYNSRGVSGGTAVRVGGDLTHLSNNLIGYWKMDEASWDGTSGEVIDSSGNQNHSRANCTDSCSEPTTGSAKFGRGAVLDGSDDYLSSAPGNNMNFGTGDVTMTAWINPTSVGDQGIVSYIGTDRRLRFMLNINNRSRFGIWNGSSWIESSGSSPIISTNRWTHVAIVFERSSRARFYIDGVEAASLDISSASEEVLTYSNLFIGYDPWVGGSYFEGRIDDVRIYNRALSSPEIRGIYEWSPGPTLHFSFSDNTGTSTVPDISGYGRNGSMSGFSSQSWVPGRFGSALRFDGSSTRISTTTTLSEVILADQGTMMAWIKPTGSPPTSSEAYNLQLIMGDDGQYAQITRGISGGQDRIWIYNWDGNEDRVGVTYNVNEWVHVTWVHRDGNLYAYKNGVLAGSVSSGNTSSLSSFFFVGSNTTNVFDRFEGVIDEVKTFNYALSSEQIVREMNAGHPIGGSPVGSQVAHWKFDEGYGTTARDSIGLHSGNEGILNGNTTWAGSDDCKINRCLYFDGTNSYVNIDHDTSFNNASEQTISGWIKLSRLASAAGDDQMIFFRALNSDPWFTWQIYQRSSDDRLVVNFVDSSENPGSAISQSSLDQDVWYHIAFVFDQNRPYLYIDGVDQTSTVVETSTGTLINSDGGVYVGGLIASKHSQAHIDEVKIYNVALTQEQILVDMNHGSVLSASVGQRQIDNLSGGAGDPPVAYWNFNENTGTTVHDRSGNNLHASFENSPVWVPGRYGSALDFPTSTSHLTVPNNSLLSPPNDMTASAWVKINSLPGSGGSSGTCGMILNQSHNSSPWYAYQFYVGGSAEINFDWRNNSSTNFSSGSSAGAVTTNTWYHLAFMRQGSSLRIFINGRDVTDWTSGTPSGNIFNSNGVFRINSPGTSCVNHLDAVFDEVKVWDYALSPAQLAYEYNRGAPIGHWKADEALWDGTSGEIKDSSGNNYHGVRGGTATTVAEGKFGRAGSFNGSTDFANVYSSGLAGHFSGNTGTITAWGQITDSGVWTDSTTNGLLQFGVDSNNRVRFYKRSSTDALKTEYIAGGTNRNADCPNQGSNWFFLAMAWDASEDKVWHYCNGELVSTSTGLGTWSGVLDSTRAVFGSQQTTSSSTRWAGNVDDVRVYNYPLSPTQIRQVMNEGAGVRFGQ